MNQSILNRKEAAEYLKISVSTLKKLDIPTLKIGDRILYPQTTLEKWIEDNTKKRQKN